MNSLKKNLAVETRFSRADEANLIVELAQLDQDGYKLLALGRGDKLRRLKADCGSPQGHVVVAELEGKIVGTLHKKDQKNGSYFIEEVIVNSTYRGKGVGVLLFLHLLTETKCRGLEAKSLSENESVAQLNLKMGMKMVNSTPKGKIKYWRAEVTPINKHKIIDCHVNLCPKELFPPNFQNTNSGISTQFEFSNTTSRLLNVMDSAGISKSVILPFPSNQVDPNKVTNYIYEAYQKYPDRFRFLPLISADIDYWLKKGACGFKENSYLMRCYRDTYLKQYKKIAEKGVPLMLHPHMQDKVDRIKYTLGKIPNLKILLCHSGRNIPFSGKGVIEVAHGLYNFGEVYFNTSTVWDATVIRKLVGIVGPERVLFGSDHPFGLVKGYRDRVIARELAFVRACGLLSEQLSLVLHDNAERLFGFSSE